MSKKVVIGALGLSDLKTTYSIYDEQMSFATSYYMSALASYFQPDQVIALVTVKAKEKHQETFSAEILERTGKDVLFIDIPDGSADVELWQIIEKLATSLEEDNEVYIDITNGFRSLPIVLLSAMSYLRQIGRVTISDILYGALDSQQNGIVPTVSLFIYLDMIDWNNAYNAFRRTGDCAYIATMFDDTSHSIVLQNYLQKYETLITSVIQQLRHISLALDLSRPLEIMDDAVTLIHQLDQVKTFLKPPFNNLIPRIIDEFRPFALARSEAKTHIGKFLSYQMELMEWYAHYERYDNLSLLMSEWLITFVLWKTQGSSIQTEQLFDIGFRKDPKNFSQPHSIPKQTFDFLKFRQKMSDVRNSIAHVGMNNNTGPTKAEEVKEEICRLYESLKTLKKYC